MADDIEIDATVSSDGVHGKFKRVSKLPFIIKPCEHAVFSYGTFRKKLVMIHGKEDGTSSYQEIGADQK